MQKVSEWIDIEAPCQEILNTVTDVERRMQLSPLWGLSQLLGISPNFPTPGSSYRVRVLTDVPFGIAGGVSNAVHGTFESLMHIMSLKMGHSASSADQQLSDQSQGRPAPVIEVESRPEEVPAEKNIVEAEQEYFVSECQPPNRMSYYLDADCKTIVTWRFQSIPRGTRVHYEEVFCDENIGGEDFLPTIRHVVHEWLVNIKRYSELRGTRSRLLIRKLLDRFYLKLRPDQRRTVLLILVVQGLALVTFVIAAIGLGIAGLLF